MKNPHFKHNIAALMKIKPFLCNESQMAWVPLVGLREKNNTRVRVYLWLKPFKGGYSNNRRVVNNLICIYHDIIDILINYKNWILEKYFYMFKSEPIVSDIINSHDNNINDYKFRLTYTTDEYEIWRIAFIFDFWFRTMAFGFDRLVFDEVLMVRGLYYRWVISIWS